MSGERAGRESGDRGAIEAAPPQWTGRAVNLPSRAPSQARKKRTCLALYEGERVGRARLPTLVTELELAS